LETGELIKGETKPKRYTYLLGANEACTNLRGKLTARLPINFQICNHIQTLLQLLPTFWGAGGLGF
jgi:hypothetical protein